MFRGKIVTELKHDNICANKQLLRITLQYIPHCAAITVVLCTLSQLL